MTNTPITTATATTPQATDKIPLGRPGDPTAYNITPPQLAALGPSIDENVTATGSAQGDAYPMTKGVTVFTTVAANTGGVLPATPTTGLMLAVNDGANQLNIYPASGGTITGAGGADTPVQVPVDGSLWCIWKGGLNWSVR
jgi:hypothetical protein